MNVLEKQCNGLKPVDYREMRHNSTAKDQSELGIFPSNFNTFTACLLIFKQPLYTVRDTEHVSGLAE